jgi:hypothetical protein
MNMGKGGGMGRGSKVRSLSATESHEEEMTPSVAVVTGVVVGIVVVVVVAAIATRRRVITSRASDIIIMNELQEDALDSPVFGWAQRKTSVGFPFDRSILDASRQ